MIRLEIEADSEKKSSLYSPVNAVLPMQYCPEIDGLRAIAILSVVFFHAELGVPGGFVGVDVFFVISGFLITSIIIRDLERGSFTLTNFLERRARRILPAMFVVLIATVVAGWFLLLPGDYQNLGGSVACESLFTANFYFWRDTGYFSGAADQKPLLHTWSLSVEEQFYFFLPLLLVGLFRICNSSKNLFHYRTSLIMFCFATGIVACFLLSIYGVIRHPAAAFYLLPTRAWELLCGSIIAATQGRWIPNSRRIRNVFSILGLLGVAIPCWFYDKSTPFPGTNALPPVLGAACVLWVFSNNVTCPSNPATNISRFLTWPPIVFVGLISYSLYLWHWPLFVFSKYWLLGKLPFLYRAALVLFAFALAVLSWRYVETPFRKRAICARQSSMFAFAAVTILLSFSIGIGLIYGEGFPFRLPALAIEYSNSTNDKGFIHEVNTADVRSDRLIHIGSTKIDEPISLLIWGDSHAMAAAPAFDQFLKENDLVGRQATASATAPVLGGAYWQSEFTNEESANSFNDAVFEYVKKNQISNVVLVGYWEYYSNDKGAISLDSALLSTVKQLVQIGTRPHLLLQVPSPRFDVPKALAMKSVFNFNLTPYLSLRAEQISSDRGIALNLQMIRDAGCEILDPRPYFLNDSNDRYIVEKNHISIYRDSHHLSVSGAKMILLPFLRDRLSLKPDGT